MLKLKSCSTCGTLGTCSTQIFQCLICMKSKVLMIITSLDRYSDTIKTKKTAKLMIELCHLYNYSMVYTTQFIIPTKRLRNVKWLVALFCDQCFSCCRKCKKCLWDFVSILPGSRYMHFRFAGRHLECNESGGIKRCRI